MPVDSGGSNKQSACEQPRPRATRMQQGEKRQTEALTDPSPAARRALTQEVTAVVLPRGPHAESGSAAHGEGSSSENLMWNVTARRNLCRNATWEAARRGMMAS